MLDAAIFLSVVVLTRSLANPFASSVVEYSPAPGQFTQNPAYNDPADALGPPAGMGIADGNNLTVVTLGGFGGSITLGFDHTVEDDPLNPWGMDAIVFGNAFWVGGNHDRHWAECATIGISRDANDNGIADDQWFIIPGSHYASSQWSGDALLLPAVPFGSNVIVNNAPAPDAETIWGYAEYSPTLLLGDMNADNVVEESGIAPSTFYTVPDDPFTVSISHGSGGGDAFDIAWAIDPITGEPGNLTGFDFIRLTTAVQSSLGPLGEKSAEIDAVADVSPDYSGDFDSDLDLDLFDVAELLICVASADGKKCAGVDKSGDGTVDEVELIVMLFRLTGPR